MDEASWVRARCAQGDVAEWGPISQPLPPHLKPLQLVLSMRWGKELMRAGWNSKRHDKPQGSGGERDLGKMSLAGDGEGDTVTVEELEMQYTEQDVPGKAREEEQSRCRRQMSMQLDWVEDH